MRKTELLALLIASVSLALSLRAWWSAPAEEPPPRSLPTPIATTAVEGEPPPTALCDGPTPVGNLGALMNDRVNPMMTQLSFTLYHASGAARLKTVGESAAKLMSCVHLAAGFKPTLRLAELGLYYQFLEDLGANVDALRLSALEGDEAGARHWFLHVKQGCNGCHARFRSTKAKEGKD